MIGGNPLTSSWAVGESLGEPCFLGWHGPTPGYTQLVLAFGRRWRLRAGRAVRRGVGIEVEWTRLPMACVAA
jgi:hypothetical protein